MNAARTIIRWGLIFTLAACLACIVVLTAVAVACEVLLRQERSLTRQTFNPILRRLGR